MSDENCDLLIMNMQFASISKIRGNFWLTHHASIANIFICDCIPHLIARSLQRYSFHNNKSIQKMPIEHMISSFVYSFDVDYSSSGTWNCLLCFPHLCITFSVNYEKKWNNQPNLTLNVLKFVSLIFQLTSKEVNFFRVFSYFLACVHWYYTEATVFFMYITTMDEWVDVVDGTILRFKSNITYVYDEVFVALYSSALCNVLQKLRCCWPRLHRRESAWICYYLAICTVLFFAAFLQP